MYRDSRGQLSSARPARAPVELICIGSALAADGSCAEPQLPPPDSPFELCPDASGAICYNDRDLGTAQWDPPPGSTPLQPSVFADVPAFSSQPPPYPVGVGLGSLRGTRWEPLYEDARNRVRLYNVDTGAIRDAPWISLRTAAGCVFFANLVSEETRWLPPRRWMAGWLGVSTCCLRVIWVNPDGSLGSRILCRYCRRPAEGAPDGPQADSCQRGMPLRVSYGGATCAGHERKHVEIDAWVLPSNRGCKCAARRGSGRGSAQLSTPYPCRAALLQHPRPPLQGAAAGAHLVVLWSEQSQLRAAGR